ncbi:MAG TPA: DUF6807 family protein [Tepidisphaeraceae bacterium]|jgi:hypothetical protein
MSLFELPYALELTLENDAIARPDGGVAIPIDGHDLLARVGAAGHLDFDSIRVLNFGNTLRDTPVQFVPDADFDPVVRPRGMLWFRLYKYTWDDESFPRRFRVCFDRLRDGGKKPWTRAGLDQPGTPLTMNVRPDAVEIRRAGSADVAGEGPMLAFSFPPNRKPALHPLTTPGGAVVTETMPRDHAWHRGVWFGWTNLACDTLAVPGYIAWMEPHTAVVRDSGLSRLTSGPVMQAFTSDSIWCTPDGQPILRASWRTEFQTIDAGWNWIDLTLTLSASRDGVTLGSDYGHLTARAAMDLRDTYMLDSACADGQPLTAPSREDVEIRWAGYAGTKPSGKPVCLLMLDHPSNPGRPLRDYFYEIRNFPIEQGALFIAMSLNALRGRPRPLPPDSPLTWRYRLVTSDRPLTPAFAEYHYANWSTPWRATWTAAAPST